MRFALLLAAGLLACADGDEGGGPTPRGIDCDERFPSLSWENYGHGAMDEHCAGCHSSLLRSEQRNNAPLGVDLDTLEGAMEWADRALVRTVDEGTMPPGATLTDEDALLMEEWLVCDLGARGGSS